MFILSRTTGEPARFSLPLLILCLRPALADAIDGDWCLGDGSKLTINGPDIVTPKGNQLKGTTIAIIQLCRSVGRTRRGGTVAMVLMSEIQMRHKPPGGEADLAPLRQTGELSRFASRELPDQTRQLGWKIAVLPIRRRSRTGTRNRWRSKTRCGKLCPTGAKSCHRPPREPSSVRRPYAMSVGWSSTVPRSTPSPATWSTRRTTRLPRPRRP